MFYGLGGAGSITFYTLSLTLSLSLSLRYPLAVDYKKQMRPSGWEKAFARLGGNLTYYEYSYSYSHSHSYVYVM